jgi:hypothetical protein
VPELFNLWAGTVTTADSQWRCTMAQKVLVQLVDDLDGTAADDITTVTFGLDGATYEIDLTANNAAKLRNRFGDFVDAGRRTGGRVKRGTSPIKGAAPTAANREQTKAIRDWARQSGFELSDRGRIPANVIEAFEQAHTSNGKQGKKK